MPPRKPHLLERLTERIVRVPLSGKFGQDMVWNLVSFGILGVSGVLLTVLIGRFYGAATLGVFNQVFALYTLLSQLAVFGVHYSAVKHVAEFSDDPGKCDVIVSSSLAITALCAGVVYVAGYLLSGHVGRLFDSPGVQEGWVCVLPGLWALALSKVLLGVLNGRRFMKAFAVGQALRFVLFIVFLVGFVVLGVSGDLLPLCVSAAEIVVLVFLLLYVLRFHRFVGVRQWAGWAWRHLSFGARGLLSGIMAVLLFQIDVLMLGYFSTDRAVGIFTMASMLVQAFCGLAVVARNNVNPLLTQFVAQGRVEELKRMVRRGIRIMYPIMGGIGIAAILTFPLVVRLLVSGGDFMASWAPFAILMTGLMLYAGYMPFDMLLVQAGHPGTHTLLVAATVLTNAVLNVVLIPRLDVQGAAYATAVSFVLSIVYLKLLVRGRLGIRI